ncbi:MAG: hypothetical protein NWF00_10630 [Candidatus Bathyarchaeota archaeon]|nr:hypothetical protein [Candidatus Bathyarchaeota archaeon]
MKPTKLEEYVIITKIVAQQGPLSPLQISEQTKTDSKRLKEQLDFLVEQEILNQQSCGKKATHYTVSATGIKVLKFFGLNKPTKNSPNNPDNQEPK